MLSDGLRSLRDRPLLSRILSSMSWQMADRVLRMVVNLGVGVWVARYLGPHDFGVLNFAIAFVALFSPIADLGLQSIVVRDLVKRGEQRTRILASAIALRMIGAAAAVSFAVASIGIARPDSESAQFIVLAVALSLFVQAWDVVDYDYQARMHARPITVIRSVSLLVFAAVRIGLIVTESDLIWFAWAIAGEAALSALLMSVLLKRDLPEFSLLCATGAEMKSLAVTCWPLAVASLSVILYMRIDQVMLGHMLSDEAVGVFSAAVRVSEAWYFVPMAIVAATAPALTAAHRASERDYRSKLSLLMRMMFGLSVVVALTLTFLSTKVIGLLYGVHYADSAHVLAIHAWAGVFVGLGVAANAWFVNADLLKLRMIHTLVGAIANVLLNLFMIPRFGATGAAVSTLVSYSLAAFWLNVLSDKTRALFFMQLSSMLLLRRAAS